MYRETDRKIRKKDRQKERMTLQEKGDVGNEEVKAVKERA